MAILVKNEESFARLIVDRTLLILLMCLLRNAKINSINKYLQKNGQRILKFLEKPMKALRICAYYFVCCFYG